jgi:hypothetical protein
MIARALIPICLAGILIIAEAGCGGGISMPLPSIATSSLPNGMVTSRYSQTVRTTGGVSPFVWVVSSGSLPHDLTLASSSSNSATIAGTPDTAETGHFTISVEDAVGQRVTKAYSLNINNAGSAQLQPASGEVPAGVVEIQGLSAGPFNPGYWQQNTLNWLPDVRMPILAAQTTSPYQNIYAPWPLDQPNGWRLFYGGWDGLNPPYDEIYSTTTSDFLTFGARTESDCPQCSAV